MSLYTFLLNTVLTVGNSFEWIRSFANQLKGSEVLFQGFGGCFLPCLFCLDPICLFFGTGAFFIKKKKHHASSQGGGWGTRLLATVVASTSEVKFNRSKYIEWLFWFKLKNFESSNQYNDATIEFKLQSLKLSPLTFPTHQLNFESKKQWNDTNIEFKFQSPKPPLYFSQPVPHISTKPCLCSVTENYLCKLCDFHLRQCFSAWL